MALCEGSTEQRVFCATALLFFPCCRHVQTMLGLEFAQLVMFSTLPRPWVGSTGWLFTPICLQVELSAGGCGNQPQML